MLKIEKEYQEKYGDIPEKDFLSYAIDKFPINRCKLNIEEEISRIQRIKWEKIEFTIYLIPHATPRPRLGKGGIFYVKGAKDNKKYFEKFMQDKNFPMIITPTKFSCLTYFPIPSSMNNTEKILAEMGLIRPISKPDWDNLGKSYCDMITDRLIYDDRLIIEGITKKFYSIKPRIEIVLKYMVDFDSQYNKKKLRKVVDS